MKKIICACVVFMSLMGCGDGYNQVKVRKHLNETRPNEVCVNAPSHGDEFSPFGFICKDKNGTVSYVFYGGSDVRPTVESILIKGSK